jgi:integrase
MARKSYQRGLVEPHRGKWSVLYRERTSKGWVQRRKYLEGCKNEKDALNKAATFMVEVNERNNNPRKETEHISFTDFANGLWASYQANEGLQESTIYSYQSMINNYFLPAFGNKSMDRISPADMTSFFNSVRGKVSAKYASNMYALLNTMFEVAYQHDLVPSKPIRSKLHKPKFEVGEKPALAVETIRAIILAVPEDYRVFFVLLAVTGARLGECIALRWLNFDEERRELSITHSLWHGRLKPPKTKASERTFHLPEQIVQILRGHRSKSAFGDETDFIFSKADGRPYDPDHLRECVLYPVMDELEIERREREHGFHIFRHSAGSILHARTGDLKVVQEILGHSRISTTSDIYVHVDHKVTESATEVLAREIFSEGMIEPGNKLVN